MPMEDVGIVRETGRPSGVLHAGFIEADRLVGSLFGDSVVEHGFLVGSLGPTAQAGSSAEPPSEGLRVA